MTHSQPLNGQDGIRQYLQDWFSAFPDIKLTVMNRVATEDHVASELECKDTNNGTLQLAPGMPASPAINRKVHGKETYFVHFKNGRQTIQSEHWIRTIRRNMKKRIP